MGQVSHDECLPDAEKPIVRRVSSSGGGGAGEKLLPPPPNVQPPSPKILTLI